MNCPKCSKPMREYLGLIKTDWDCINEDCGKSFLSTETRLMPDTNWGLTSGKPGQALSAELPMGGDSLIDIIFGGNDDKA